jgi:Predicted membrane protein
MDYNQQRVQRDDLHLLTQHSNLSTTIVEEVLTRDVYAKRSDWQKFLQIMTLTLGVGFTVTGIIFFFAYNWQDLHKFVKLGIISTLLIASIVITLIPSIKDWIKHIVITGASMLVGALFAVFGQIYQTGANAYDFFLVWSLFITIWVFVSNFPPLTLLYVALLNTTIILYEAQVASGWTTENLFFVLCLLNSIVFAGLHLFKHVNQPLWFVQILALSIVIYATIGTCIGINNFDSSPSSILIFILTSILYTAGIYYSLKIKKVQYLAMIGCSILIILSTLFLQLSDGEMLFFFLSFRMQQELPCSYHS